MEAPEPRDVHQLRSLLGSVNYILQPSSARAGYDVNPAVRAAEARHAVEVDDQMFGGGGRGEAAAGQQPCAGAV